MRDYKYEKFACRGYELTLRVEQNITPRQLEEEKDKACKLFGDFAEDFLSRGPKGELVIQWSVLIKAQEISYAVYVDMLLMLGVLSRKYLGNWIALRLGKIVNPVRRHLPLCFAEPVHGAQYCATLYSENPNAHWHLMFIGNEYDNKHRPEGA